MTPVELAEYLVERELITVESIVDGDLVIVDMSRRNRNFSVVRRRGPSLFVKQANLQEPEAISSVEREAWLYWLIQNDHRCGALRPFVPRSHLYDPKLHLHVLDRVDGDNLGEQLRGGCAAPELAARLGEALALAHACVGAAASGASPAGPLRGDVPWILYFHQKAGVMPTLSPGNAALARWLNSRPEIRNSLGAVQANWRHDALMHGDLKLDNCLGSIQHDSTNGIAIVDWELGDVGDAAWDVGTVLQGYVSQALFASYASGEPTLGTTTVAALAQFRPAARAFWSAYANRRGLRDRAVRYRELVRTIIWSGARMIQTAYECLVNERQIHAPAAALVETAAWLMWQPEAAVRVVFDEATP